MVEIGGGGSGALHEDPFKEAGSRNAQRAANASQIALMATTLRPRPRRGGNRPMPVDHKQQLKAEYERVARDARHVAAFLWGDGARQPGVGLAGAYQAWLRAAGTVDADPYGARVVMELCRQRIAACPGGPDLLRVYEERLYQGMAPAEAMRRAWTQTEPARQATPGGRPHPGAPHRPALTAPMAGSGNLPVPSGTARGPAEVDPSTAVREAVQLLGAAEVTMTQLRGFQRRYGQAAARDGAMLARQWLAEATRSGAIDTAQHDTWLGLVERARHSPQHTRWRVANGLDPTPAVRAGGGVDEHLAAHAGQHHRGSDRHLGNAVDNPRTPDVDEQAQLRQQAYVERKTAEVYDTMAHSPDAGLRARAAAARPSPAALAHAAPPPELAGKRTAPVIAARPTVPPAPGRR